MDEHPMNLDPGSYPSDRERAVLAERWNAHPGMQHMGVRLDLSVPGEVCLEVDPILPFHRGGLGTDAVNGAIISGVFDLATGLSGYLHALGRRVGVAQLNIQFLQPVNGDRFRVIGRPRRVGRSLIFTSARLLDERDQVCARCEGIVAVSGSAARMEDGMAL